MNALSLAAWFAALFASSSLFSHDVALRLMLLALGLVCATVAAVMHRRELHLLPAIWWPFLLWAGWAALSLTWSIEPDRSDKEFRNEIVYVALAFLVCYIGAQAPRATRTIIAIMGTAGTLLCAAALYSFLRGFQDQDGWHGGPGNLSSALLVLMPCTLTVGWHDRQLRPVAIALALLILLAGYATLNRTIWFGFSIEFLLLSGFIAMRAAEGKQRAMRRTTFVAAVAVVISLAVVGAHVQLERQETNPGIALGHDPRLSIWPEVLERIKAAPFTGYGFGRGLLRHDLTKEFDNGQFWHAHNLFLDLALQTGVPGVVLFLLLITAIVSKGWLAYRSGGDEAVVASGIAVLAVVAGMLVRNMSDTLLVRQNSLFFWATIGLLLGRIERPSKG